MVMFQAHCYNSWLSPKARSGHLYIWSQLLATVPAPLFIFLAGLSFAMVTQRLRAKGASSRKIAQTTILRGAEIYGLALLFRVQEFALGYPNAPWTDLLRVDVLNILGLSMMLMGVLCRLTSSSNVHRARINGIGTGLVLAALIAVATPWLWTSYRPAWLPWPLESYINGVHTFNVPQPWLFPLFPWSAFAFVGLALGFLLFSKLAHTREAFFFLVILLAGVAASAVSIFLDSSPTRLYPPRLYDYWHTSPNFFLMRCGILLALVFLAYAWCRWGFAQRGFSPIIQLGNTSLLVYWVHIEFVYGRFSILPKAQCSVARATLGLLIIFIAMVGLSLLRTNWKKRRTKALRSTPQVAVATAESG